MLKHFETVDYIPIIRLRPAEMEALQQLPTGDKDKLLPYIQLRPWLSSKHFSKSHEILERAFGKRAVIAGLDNEYDPEVQNRPAQQEFEDLKGSTSTWLTMYQQHANYLPAIRNLLGPSAIERISSARKLGRGLVIHLTYKPTDALLGNLHALKENLLPFNDSLLIILDFLQLRENSVSFYEAKAIEAIDELAKLLPLANISISSTSFPSEFSVASQDILERILFRNIQRKYNAAQLIYSDKASTRDVVQNGGGKPWARIDLPTRAGWSFYRSQASSTYSEVAAAAIKSPQWDPKLMIWGTELIQRTAVNAPGSINSAAKSTAVRINLHIHQQLHYNNPTDLYSTDEPWQE